MQVCWLTCNDASAVEATLVVCWSSATAAAGWSTLCDAVSHPAVLEVMAGAHLECLLQELPKHPVIAANGVTYERWTIEAWLHNEARSGDCDLLLPNFGARDVIASVTE